MKYSKPYLWWPSYRTHKHIANFKWRERKTKALTFTYGKKLPFDSSNPNLEYTKKDPSEYDLIFNSEVEPSIFSQYDNLTNNGNGLLLVNKKVIDILMTLCPDDIQLFPATIIPENPKKMTFANHDYWVLNLTKTVDVIDEENSVFDVAFENRITNIKKLSFIEKSNYNFYMGRQCNYPLHVIVSPELVKIFKKEKITGVKFKKDFEYIR